MNEALKQLPMFSLRNTKKVSIFWLEKKKSLNGAVPVDPVFARHNVDSRVSEQNAWWPRLS